MKRKTKMKLTRIIASVLTTAMLITSSDVTVLADSMDVDVGVSVEETDDGIVDGTPVEDDIGTDIDVIDDTDDVDGEETGDEDADETGDGSSTVTGDVDETGDGDESGNSDESCDTNDGESTDEVVSHDDSESPDEENNDVPDDNVQNTTESEETDEPDETIDPSDEPASDTTTEPSGTPGPEETQSPEETTDPSNSTDTENTTNPEDTVDPADPAEPTESTEPADDNELSDDDNIEEVAKEYTISFYTLDEFTNKEDGSIYTDYVLSSEIETHDGGQFEFPDVKIVYGAEFIGWSLENGEDVPEVAESDLTIYAGYDYASEELATFLVQIQGLSLQDNTSLTLGKIWSGYTDKIIETDISSVGDISENITFTGKWAYYVNTAQNVWNYCTTDELLEMEITTQTFIYPIYNVPVQIDWYAYNEDFEYVSIKHVDEVREVFIPSFYTDSASGSNVTVYSLRVTFSEYEEPVIPEVDGINFNNYWKYEEVTIVTKQYSQCIVDTYSGNTFLHAKLYANYVNNDDGILLDDGRILFKNQYAEGIYNPVSNELVVSMFNADMCKTTNVYQKMPWYKKLFYDRNSLCYNNPCTLRFSGVEEIPASAFENAYVGDIDLTGVKIVNKLSFWCTSDFVTRKLINTESLREVYENSLYCTNGLVIPDNFFDEIEKIDLTSIHSSNRGESTTFASGKVDVVLDNIEILNSSIMPKSLEFGNVVIGHGYVNNVLSNSYQDYGIFSNMKVDSVTLQIKDINLYSVLNCITIDDWSKCDFTVLEEISSYGLKGSNVDENWFEYFPNVKVLNEYCFYFCKNMDRLLFDPTKYIYKIDVYKMAGNPDGCIAYCENTNYLPNGIFTSSNNTELDLSGITVVGGKYSENTGSYSDTSVTSDNTVHLLNYSDLIVINDDAFIDCFRIVDDLYFPNVILCGRYALYTSSGSYTFDKVKYFSSNSIYLSNASISAKEVYVNINTDSYVSLGLESISDINDSLLDDIQNIIYIRSDNIGSSFIGGQYNIATVNIANAKQVSIANNDGTTSVYNKTYYNCDSATDTIVKIYNEDKLFIPKCETMIQYSMIPPDTFENSNSGGVYPKYWELQNIGNFEQVVGYFNCYNVPEYIDLSISTPYFKGGLAFYGAKKLGDLDLDGVVKFDLKDPNRIVFNNKPITDYIGRQYGLFVDCSTGSINPNPYGSMSVRMFRSVHSNTLLEWPDMYGIQGNSVNEDVIASAGNCLYSDFDRLESVDLPVCEKIGSFTFAFCGKLTDNGINLPVVREIGKCSFINTFLQNIDFPTLEIVGDAAFAYNYGEDNGSYDKLCLGLDKNRFTNIVSDSVRAAYWNSGAINPYNYLYNVTGGGHLYRTINLPNVRVLGEACFAGTACCKSVVSTVNNWPYANDREVLRVESSPMIVITDINIPMIKDIPDFTFAYAVFGFDVSDWLDSLTGIGSWAFSFAQVSDNNYKISDLNLISCKRLGYGAIQLAPLSVNNEKIENSLFSINTIRLPVIENMLNYSVDDRNAGWLRLANYESNIYAIKNGSTSTVDSFDGTLVKHIKFYSNSYGYSMVDILDFEYEWIEPQSIEFDNETKMFTITSKLYEPLTNYDGHLVEDVLGLVDLYSLYEHSYYENYGNKSLNTYGYSYNGAGAGYAPAVWSGNLSPYFNGIVYKTSHADLYNTKCYYNIRKQKFGSINKIPYAISSGSNYSNLTAAKYDLMPELFEHFVSAIVIDPENKLRDGKYNPAYNVESKEIYKPVEVQDAMRFTYTESSGTVYLTWGSYESGMHVLTCEYENITSPISGMETYKIEPVSRNAIGVDNINKTTGNNTSNMVFPNMLTAGYLRDGFDLKVYVHMIYNNKPIDGYMLLSESSCMNYYGSKQYLNISANFDDISYANYGYLKYKVNSLGGFNQNVSTQDAHSLVLYDTATDEKLLDIDDVSKYVNTYTGVRYWGKTAYVLKDNIEYNPEFYVEYDKDVYNVEMLHMYNRNAAGNAIYTNSNEAKDKNISAVGNYADYIGIDIDYSKFGIMIVVTADENGDGKADYTSATGYYSPYSLWDASTNVNKFGNNKGVLPYCEPGTFTGYGQYVFKWDGKKPEFYTGDEKPFTFTMTYPSPDVDHYLFVDIGFNSKKAGNNAHIGKWYSFSNATSEFITILKIKPVYVDGTVGVEQEIEYQFDGNLFGWSELADGSDSTKWCESLLFDKDDYQKVYSHNVLLSVGMKYSYENLHNLSYDGKNIIFDLDYVNADRFQKFVLPDNPDGGQTVVGNVNMYMLVGEITDVYVDCLHDGEYVVDEDKSVKATHYSTGLEYRICSLCDTELEPVETDMLPNYNLTLTTEINGVASDHNDKAIYNIHLGDSVGTGDYRPFRILDANGNDTGRTLMFDDDGNATLEMSDGETITIEDFWGEEEYSITSTNLTDAGYSCVVSGGSQSSNSGLTDDTRIAFSFGMRLIVPAGVTVRDDALQAMAIMCVMMLAIVGASYCSKKRVRK